jgi:hypothetical protein
MSKLFSTILPSMLAGGLLFGSVLSHAGPGSGAPPMPPMPPIPPTAPMPPMPPTPPTPPTPAIAGLPPGINVTIHDGEVKIEGVDKYVDAQIDNALKAVQNPSVPPEVRAKVEARLKKLREKLKKKLVKIDVKDLGDLGDELGDIGDEIGDEMDDFGSDMDAWGEKFGKDIQKQVQKQLAARGIHTDDDQDDSDNDTDIPSPDVDDDDDLADAVRDMGDLKLSAAQHAAIAKLRTDSDRQVEAAKKALDVASDNLKKLLENGAGEAEVSRAIDAVSQQEAAIRKARILTWLNARRILDDTQRKKVENAAKKSK